MANSSASPPKTPQALKAWLQAFESWRLYQRQIGRLRREASEQVYAAMWQALAQWAIAQHPPVALRHLDAGTLLAYIASRSGSAAPHDVLTARYQARLLGLVDRVQAHHAAMQQRAHALRAPVRLRGATSPAPDTADEVPAHLSADQAQALQDWLCRDPGPAARWQVLRNRCGVALQLGAGLGPGDVRALTLADVVVRGIPSAGQPQPLPRSLTIAANGSSPAHEAALAPWAAALLGHWLHIRSAQGLGGEWLFPSTRSGKPWGKVAQYNAARAVLTEAGLPADDGGSFKLRHSFALRQLLAGRPPELVSAWLGVVDPSVMGRYRLALGQKAGGAEKAPNALEAKQGSGAWQPV